MYIVSFSCYIIMNLLAILTELADHHIIEP